MSNPPRRRSSGAAATTRFKPVGEAVLFWGMLALLALTQLAFGGVYIWSWYMVACGAAALSAFYCLSLLLDWRLREHPGPAQRFRLPKRLLLLIALLAGLPLVQLVPLPAGLVEAVSPNAHDAWQRLAALGVTSALERMPLSLDPTRTQADIFKYFPAMFFLFAAAATLRSTTRLRTFALFLAGMGLVQCFYGAYQTYGPQQRIWWWENTLHEGFVTGTYLNRNHLAGFLELCIPVSVVLALRYRRSALGRNATGNGTPPRHLAILSSLFFVVPAILAISLVLTGSRAGMVSAAVTAAGIGVLLRTRLRDSSSLRPGLLLFLGLLLAGLAYVGVDDSLARFTVMEEFVRRIDIYTSSAPLVLQYPVLGSGLGTFNELYSTVALPAYAGAINLLYAHNDWLQIAVELGGVGLLAGLALLGVVVRETLRGREAPRSFQRDMSLALLFGIVSISMHNLVDFNFHVPANLFAYAAATGAALRIPWLKVRNGSSRSRRSAERSGAERSSGSGTGGAGRVRVLPALGVFAACAALLFAMTGRFRAESLYPVYPNITVDYPVFPLERLETSLKLDPRDPNRIRERGKLYLLSSTGTTPLDTDLSRRAGELLQSALALQPFNEENWLYYAISRIQAPENPGQAAAEYAALEKVVLDLAPRDPRMLYLLSRARYHLADLGWKPEENTALGFDFLKLAAAGSQGYYDMEEWRGRIEDVRRRVAEPGLVDELIAAAGSERLREYLTKRLKP